MKFKKVKKVRVFEEIVEQLKDYFANSDLQPGDRLPSERDLAEQFNCSRVSVRQALTVLEAQGLLVRKVGGGTYKADDEHYKLSQLMSLLRTEAKDINEPLEVRKLMDPQIVMLAAQRATKKDIEAMRDCLRRQAEKIEAGELIVEEDSEFHLLIAQAAKNGIIVKLVEAIHDLTWETREKSIMAEQGGKRSLEGHYPILEAIENNDPDAAYEAMTRHVNEVQELIGSYREKEVNM